MEDLKTVRTSAKRAATMQISRVRQYIAEGNKDINDHVILLKDLFKVFTLAHEKYHETLTVEKDVDESDDYFCEKQKDYISALNLVKDALNSAVEDQPLKDNPKADLFRKEFLHLLNLPKVELQIFHGDPLHYHQFIRAFEANIDKICEDNDSKLSRLMQYTSGSAKEAIRSCQLVGGSSGYAKARSILENRFGSRT
ncbi:hypothetical protein BSL78_17773 [Apostichopus japonicus]|uniref:Uncharacterized protein n=1 Tax=Stichopus japonicus TaxID=307972 RepID=A0A2G8KBK0_STIJA|nr:hypothetical protein BSL78_17773 [Apostichopus japonicus]